MRPTIPVFLSLVAAVALAFAAPAFAQPHLAADEQGVSHAVERLERA